MKLLTAINTAQQLQRIVPAGKSRSPRPGRGVHTVVEFRTSKRYVLWCFIRGTTRLVLLTVLLGALALWFAVSLVVYLLWWVGTGQRPPKVEFERREAGEPARKKKYPTGYRPPKEHPPVKAHKVGGRTVVGRAYDMEDIDDWHF